MNFNPKVKIGGKIRVIFDLVKKGKIIEELIYSKRGGSIRHEGRIYKGLEKYKTRVTPHFSLLWFDILLSSLVANVFIRVLGKTLPLLVLFR